MLGELIPCGGGTALRLYEPVQIVGRNPACDVTIQSGTVSGRHCELRFAEGAWSVRDLGSKNGTRVNGVRCEQQRLEPQDRLTLGRVRFLISYSTTGDSAPSDDEMVLNYLMGDDSSAPADKERRPHDRSTKDSSRPVESRTAKHKEQKNEKQTSTKRYLGKLVPCGGGDPIALLESPLSIGRISACDIRLKRSTVSSRHCKLDFRDGYWFVTDLNSRNGIRIDGVPQESGCLMPQSILSVGNLRFQIDYIPKGDFAPAEADPFAVSLLEKAGLAGAFEDRKLPRWAEMDDDTEARRRYELNETDDLGDDT
jgi:pSer/pThr/pTyr-binding forkhead associated (FHA) protein